MLAYAAALSQAVPAQLGRRHMRTKFYSLFKVAQNSFQHFPRRLKGHNNHSFSIDATIMVSKKPNYWWTRWYYFRDTIGYHSNTMRPAGRKFKVALNPMYRICLNFARSCISSCLSKVYNRKNISPCRFLEYKGLKLKLRVFLASHSVVMVTYRWLGSFF